MGRYDITLGRYLFTALVWNIEFSKHNIKADDGPLKVSSELMVDLGTYEFKYLNIGKINLKNWLWTLTQNNYINHNKYTLVLNN